MTEFRAAVVALLLLVEAFCGPDRARAQSLIATPGTSGDQLLFFYDATAGRTPFLVVSNLAPAEVTLEIAWYSQNLSQRLATQTQTLAIGGNVILDPSQVQGVNGNAGLTVVTPVVSATDARPVVRSSAPSRTATLRAASASGRSVSTSDTDWSMRAVTMSRAGSSP